MALETRRYMDALISHASATGYFAGGVNSVDIGSMPDNSGLTAVLWPRSVRPIPERSGLASTSIVIEFMVRFFRALNTDPLGEIDPEMIDACDALLNAYSGDFTLGGLVSHVDLLGEFGEPLGMESGYIELNDSTKYRIVDIIVPLVINDVWTQEA